MGERRPHGVGPRGRPSNGARRCAAAGALIGLGLAEVAKDRLWAVGVAVLVPSIVFGLARMEPIARQAALVASVIVLIPVETQLTTPEFAAVRFAETVIGILVALLVNATVLPPRAHRGARRHLGLAIGHLATLYRLVTDAVAGGFRDEAAIVATRRSLRSELAQVDALWDEAMAESPGPDELGPGWRTATWRCSPCPLPPPPPPSPPFRASRLALPSRRSSRLFFCLGCSLGDCGHELLDGTGSAHEPTPGR